MEMLEMALLLLAAVLISSVIDQLVPKVTSPLIQIAAGVLIAVAAPTQIDITLEPEFFLMLFIAPLLYDEAKNVDKLALWRNRGIVLSLAIGLVIAITIALGFMVHTLIPIIGLTAAFALGAALGPTDAVAVSSISSQSDIEDRHKSVLAGEALINDASGIVSFQFAVAAALTGTFSLADASIEFAFSFFGGIIGGLVLGYLGNIIVRAVRGWGLENTTFHVLFEVFTPFLVFLLAESVGASGIIAVVVAGLVNVISPRAVGPSISRMNIVSSSVWRVLTFALNGVVFVLLGTQLPKAMLHTWEDVAIGNVQLVAYIVLVALALELIRFVWLFAIERLRSRRSGRKGRVARRADVKSSLVMTLAGSKGALTLVIALTLPLSFPQRDLLIFLASGVILVTLLLATFLIPLLAPKQEPSNEDVHARETESILDMLRTVIEELAAHQTDENRLATQEVIRGYSERIRRLKDTNDIEDEPNVNLRVQAIEWQQDYVMQLIDADEVHPLIGYRYLSKLANRRDLLKHHKRSEWVQNLLVNLRSLLHTGFRRVIHGLPGVSETERMEATRLLQLKSVSHTADKLQEVLASSEIDESAEDISKLLLEYRVIAASLRSQSPSLTSRVRVEHGIDDIKQLGMQLELEQIQNRYEGGEFSRATSKRLRDNVYLMQLDLENKV